MFRRQQVHGQKPEWRLGLETRLVMEPREGTPARALGVSEGPRTSLRGTGVSRRRQGHPRVRRQAEEAGREEDQKGQQSRRGHGKRVC